MLLVKGLGALDVGYAQGNVVQTHTPERRSLHRPCGSEQGNETRDQDPAG